MDTFFFSHDYNARSDEKIKQLIRKYGMQGYGVFWAIVEDLYQNANALRIDCDGIAYDLRVDSDMVKSIIFDFNLFVHDNEMFGSISIQKRIDKRKEKSAKARESAQYRWGNANALPTQCDSNAIKDIKVEESKVEDIKVEDSKSISRFAPPSQDMVHEYAIEICKGTANAPEDFYNYYESNGWKVGKNPMKNWKAAYKNWTKNEKQYEAVKGTNQHRAETKTEQNDRLYRDFGKELTGGKPLPDIFELCRDSEIKR
jgi:hypothetical protein